MPTCPFCKANLGDAEFKPGICPSCGRKLSPDQAEQRQIAAGEVEAEGSSHAAPKAETADTADSRSVAKTIPADTPSVTPSPEDNGPTAEDVRSAATLDSDNLPVAAMPEGDVPGSDDLRLAQTMDSGEPPPVSAGSVTRIWSGMVESHASPDVTLKAAIRSASAETHLVIQPHVFRQAERGVETKADYELIGKLGEGGMGVVYVARQKSIDRTVAVKVLKSKGAGDVQERGKFLSEAVVTGDLEHPNIVPIYDLGKNESGVLFYSMKRIKGTPWSAVIRHKTRQENVEILMRAADAVAFAHSRGVIHRDLKPENVMLGDFGEVLVVDWGLAVSMPASPSSTGLGGTPSYMAPEMATGPVERIGAASDVYLLGAILFEIVAGKPPHAGQTVMGCLLAAGKNEIRPTDRRGELLEIATRAMATRPEDRYATVSRFQDAIRQYQSHSQSIALASHAQEDLEEAGRSDNYETFSRALFGFQEAVSLWEENARAREGISEASLAYATSALRKGDYDLAASLLSADDPKHVEPLALIKQARQERDARQHRLTAAKRVGAGLAITVFLVVTVAFFWIRAEAERARAAEAVAEDKRQEAEDRKAEAIRQKQMADVQKAKAVAAQNEAERQRAEAVRQKQVADVQKAKAEEAQKNEEYGAYIARIGLAAAKIEENAFDKAKALLGQCPAYLRNWEWGRLMHLCTQDIRSFDARQPVEAVAFSGDGGKFATGGWGGTVRVFDVRPAPRRAAAPPDGNGRELLAIPTGGQYVFALAFSPDGKHLAAGTNDRPDYLKIYDAETGVLVRALQGHNDAVLSVAYSRDGRRLLTSSYDNTARLWDLGEGGSGKGEGGAVKTFAGHDWWVWTATFSPDEKRIVTASQDGSVIVWLVDSGRPNPPFLGHNGPVYAAAFSPDGQHVASGGYDKRVLLWRPDDVKPFDFGTLLTGQQTPPPVSRPLEGHTAAVRSVRFSADGKLLLTSGNDNTVRIWDVGTGSPLKTLRGHAGRVPSCVFVPPLSGAGSEHVLSGSHDHQAKIWSIAGYEEVRVFRGLALAGHRDAVLGAAFSPDGRQIVSASRDRTARTWDFGTGKLLRVFNEGHAFLASAAVFFPDAKKVLTAAVDNTTRIWDVASGTQLLRLEGTGPSAAVALSHDGKWILTGSDDNAAKLWDAEGGKLLRRLEGHRSEITAVAISPDDKFCFTADAKGRCRLLGARTGEEIWQSQKHSRAVSAACFLPDAKRILTASLDNTVGQWDVATGRERLSLILKHPDAVTSLAVSPDGRQALTTCVDKIVRLWEVDSGRLIRRLDTGDEINSAVAFSPDGRRALTTSSDNKVRVWDLASGGEIPAPGVAGGAFLDLSPGAGLVWSAVFSPSGDYILTVGGAEACLWDVRSGRELMTFSPQSAVASARFSPDGRRIVTGSWDNAARVWNSKTGLAQRKLEGVHTRFVNDSVFSPDGSKLLTASDDKTIRLWDAESGKLLRSFVGHQERVAGAVFSSDGRRVLSASHDRTARIWDAETGELLHLLEGHGQAVLCAALAADGRRVITGGEDNIARLWDADTGKQLPFSLQGHTASVTSVGFSPDGRRAITGSKDISAKIWDAQTGKEILTLKGHSQEITSVAFSPDGRSVLTGSRDGTLIVWLAVDWRQPGASR